MLNGVALSAELGARFVDMKAYGIPRVLDAEFPDKADIKRFGFSTSDRCSRADRGKNKARLIWKKRARADAAKEIRGATGMVVS
jgi:hypothetical protein